MSESEGHHVPRQRWFGGGLGRSAVMAISALAFFAVTILFVSRDSTPADVDPVLSEGDPETVAWDVCKAGFESRDAELLINLEGDEEGQCLAEGETVMVVQGLPGVSGVYATREGNVSVEGWSLDEGASDQPIGRCFVDPSTTFKTKAVATVLTGEGQGKLITIDVGRTGEGGPYAAVVGELGGLGDLAGAGLAAFEVTHNYNPGSGFVKMDPVIWDESNWTGVATFTPTDEAETYNDRLYSPWTNTQYLGQPNHDFTIVLICK